MIHKPYSDDEILPVDPREPSTWVNHSAPWDVSEIQRDLTRLGGLVPPGFGDLSGQPILKIVWGQTEKMFLGGKDRIRFDDQMIPHIIKQKHFLVTDECFLRCVEWAKKQEEKKRNAYLRCDWHGATRLYRIETYLRQYESSLNYKLLEEGRSVQEIAQIIPVGWKYLSDIPDITEIGKFSFFVLQWIPPKLLGTEKTWQENRYGFEWCLETGRQEWQDITGAYPKNGFYEKVVMQVALPVTIKVGNSEMDYFRGVIPTRKNTIEPIIAGLYKRENEKSETVKRAAEKRIENLRERQRIKDKEFSDQFKAMFWDAVPVGKGNPVSLPSVITSVVTKHLKGNVNGSSNRAN